jgi:selenocysteine lyase/cysteine desulfurase
MVDIHASFPFATEAVYLNTAAVGLSWVDQGQKVAAYYDAAKRRGNVGRDVWHASVGSAKSRLSALLGVRADRLYFTGSTSEGLNIVALGLPLEAGDRVALAADEFPSVLQPWLTRRNQDVAVEKVTVQRESERTEALISAIEGGARALAVSHVHWRTGTRVNLRPLSEACRRHGAWLIVDGVQAVGAVPVDAALADAYCGSSFKWLLSGFGLGFMTLSDRFLDAWTPPLRGYANEWPSKEPQYGHQNYPGIFALNASLEFLESIGWEAIHRRVADLTGRLLAVLEERGFDVVTPRETRAGIVSVRHAAAATLVRDLAAESIHVEDRDALVRASPYFYNSEDDIDRFVVALDRHSLKLTTK